MTGSVNGHGRDEMERAQPAGQVKRRGLIAAAAALAAAAFAKASERLAQAADGGNFILGSSNTTASTTFITRFGSAGLPAFFVDNQANGGYGIFSTTSGAGFAAVNGQNSSPASSPTGTGGFGVFGANSNGSASANGTGVLGLASAASSVGVRGVNSAGIGVEGDSTNSTGVIGRAMAAGNPNPGIIGSATNGYGVFGFSANSNGIAGQSGGGAAGCVGFAGAPGGYGIYGGTAVPGGYAGGCAGPVLVGGDFTVAGGAKDAVVPHPDGSHRLLYCQESPEPWFEDFGAAKLVNGRAQVTFDPDFVAVVHNDKYLVFPVPEGDCKGLYVSDKSPTGFEVRELQGGASTLAFSYRVVAKRKDIPGPRLEKVKLPEPIKELVKPDPPKPPEPPKAPERPDSGPRSR